MSSSSSSPSSVRTLLVLILVILIINLPRCSLTSSHPSVSSSQVRHQQAPSLHVCTYCSEFCWCRKKRPTPEMCACRVWSLVTVGNPGMGHISVSSGVGRGAQKHGYLRELLRYRLGSRRVCSPEENVCVKLGSKTNLVQIQSLDQTWTNIDITFCFNKFNLSLSCTTIARRNLKRSAPISKSEDAVSKM
jgi:hypothetical protein